MRARVPIRPDMVIALLIAQADARAAGDKALDLWYRAPEASPLPRLLAGHEHRGRASAIEVADHAPAASPVSAEHDRRYLVAFVLGQRSLERGQPHAPHGVVNRDPQMVVLDKLYHKNGFLRAEQKENIFVRRGLGGAMFLSPWREPRERRRPIFGERAFIEVEA